MGEIAETRTAPFLFHRDAKKAKRAEFRPQVAGKFVGPVDVVGPRRDLCLRKGADRLAQHVDVAAERIIQSGQSVADHHTLHPWPDTGLPRILASGAVGVPNDIDWPARCQRSKKPRSGGRETCRARQRLIYVGGRS